MRAPGWLLDLAEHVEVIGGNRSRWLGVASPRRPAADRDGLLAELARRLYADFYCPGTVSPPVPPARSSPFPAAAFVASLVRATHRPAQIEDGWLHVGEDDGNAIVRRTEITFRARQSELSAAAARGEPPGVRVPVVRLGMSPGFLSIHHHLPSDEPLRRFYWNVAAEGAPILVAALTGAFDGRRYALKALCSPEGYVERCDPVVVYLAESDVSDAEPLLDALYAEVVPWLEPHTPAMTERIAPGLATAGDPGPGVSFGQSRCAALAEGLRAAHAAGARTALQRAIVVAQHLRSSGIDPERPSRCTSTPIGSSGGWWSRSRPTDLDVAMEIAGRLAQRAITVEARCTWLAPEVVPDERGADSLRYRALGPDLYEGTSGIAMVLAATARATADDALRRVAVAAVEQTLALMRTAPGDGGLFTGAVGVALALGFAARRLDEHELWRQAHGLVARETRAASREPDLISGRAGEVLGLLCAARLFGDDRLRERAVAQGERLADDVRVWFRRPGGTRRALTGMAHGASGCAIALNALGETDASRIPAAIDEARRFEARHFDEASGTWADLRPGQDGGTLPPGRSWCHGAPGIGLARLRLAETDEDDALREESRVALVTTEATTRAALASGRYNFSLCHGIAGNAEILAEGAHLSPTAADLAAAIADEGARRYADRSVAWPCPTPGGTTPGLMTGLAGIAWFYLRRQDPSLPSILALRPSDWDTRSDGIWH